MATALSVAAILLLAAFTQSLTGFGLALVSMPLLGQLMPLHQASALVAVVSLVVEAALLRRYWAHLRWRPVARLTAASFLGMPLGVALLHHLPGNWLLTALGMLLIAYSLYALGNWHLPRLTHPFWAWGLGLLAGVLGGAYNTSGPPVILYGHARRWTPQVFKGNLQAFFLSTSAAIFLAHLAAGDITPSTWWRALEALPSLGLGLWLGRKAEKRLSPEVFRKIVLFALLLVGAKMLFPA